MPCSRMGEVEPSALRCRCRVGEGARRTPLSRLALPPPNQSLTPPVAYLQTSFPPRNVRGFRVLRIKCAQEGKKASQRTAQLTVWDADSLGADFFQQGQRYLVRRLPFRFSLVGLLTCSAALLQVTHVIPKGTWQRRSEEITLATRRDSRWRKVET